MMENILSMESKHGCHGARSDLMTVLARTNSDEKGYKS